MVSKMMVRLADVVPSGQNPREDFGDIDALASAIEATGGEPVNPPVLVRDGNVFRIVDGERRYRAMVKIYGAGSAREVSAIVYDSLDEANEMVAMLATDDKRLLTDAERARGVQQMLLLGVPTERVVKAARATRGQVVAARMMAGRVAEGAQVTLDQMLAASELPDEMAEEVLSAGDGWQGVASRLKRESERAAIRAVLEAALAADGRLEVVDSHPDGACYLACCRAADAEQARGDIAAAVDAGAKWAMLTRGEAWFYAPRDGAGDAERSAKREAAERDRRACADMADGVASFAALMLSGGTDGVPVDVRGEVADWVVAFMPRTVKDAGEDVLAPLRSAAGRSPELCAAMLIDRAGDLSRTGCMNWDLTPYPRYCRALCDLYDSAAICGWEPTEADRAKRMWAADFVDGD